MPEQNNFESLILTKRSDVISDVIILKKKLFRG